MQSVGQIIRERREALGLTLQALANEVGATKSYISMIENHKVNNPPSRAVLDALERALAIADGELRRAADWENTPEQVKQQLLKARDEAQRGRELAERLRHATARRPDGAKDLDKMLPDLRRQANAVLRAEPAISPLVAVRYQVPLINKVAAGYPRDFTDLDYPARVADESVSCPDLTDSQAFAARVVGDSMVPDYREGDVVVFSPAAKVTDGSDCFVRLEPDHQTTFKRVFFEADKRDMIRLQPLNPKFPPQVLPRDRVAGLYKAVARYQKIG